jgi:hypothetical protein
MAKFTLKDLDSKYTVINGHAAEFFTSITGQLCVRWGSDPWNNGNPYVATVNDDGSVTDADHDYGKIYQLEPISKHVYQAISTANVYGFMVSSNNQYEPSMLDRAESVVKDKNKSLAQLSKETHIPEATLKSYRANPDKLSTAAWNRVDTLAKNYGIR